MEKKITIRVLIENDRVFENNYVVKQPIKVIVSKTVDHFSLVDGSERILRREDGTPLKDPHVKIEEAFIRDGETLRYFLKSPKPDDRDKGFAFDVKD